METAEEFLRKKHNINGELQAKSQIEDMIEFAKMHVTEALKEALESIYVNATCNICCTGAEILFNENPIANVYPLHRIE